VVRSAGGSTPAFPRCHDGWLGQLDRLPCLAPALPNIEMRALPFGVRLAAWAMTSFDVVGDKAEVELAG
jgi:hypothetical protein